MEVERLRAIAMRRVEDSTGIAPARLVEELAHVALLDPKDFYGEDGRLFFLREMPEHAGRAIARLEAEDRYEEAVDGNGTPNLIKTRISKLRPNDKLSAIDKLARLLGGKKDKKDVEHQSMVRLVWGDEE